MGAEPGFQYFAAYDISGIRVETSTVQPTSGDATRLGEGVGAAPWEHFELISIEGHQLPVVASELRLLSEAVAIICPGGSWCVWLGESVEEESAVRGPYESFGDFRVAFIVDL